MGWKFWSNHKNGMIRIDEQLTQVGQRLDMLCGQQSEGVKQTAELTEQLRKLGRLQYKTSQGWQGRLDELNAGLAAVRQWQAVYTVDKPRLDTLERQTEYLAEFLITWLDDLDLLTSHLHKQGQVAWHQLLDKWTLQVRQALELLGLQEIPVLGTSFDASIAECLGTVERPQNTGNRQDEKVIQLPIPYEVAEVVNRGFISRDGSLRRKAQVIIYGGNQEV